MGVEVGFFFSLSKKFIDGELKKENQEGNTEASIYLPVVGFTSG